MRPNHPDAPRNPQAVARFRHLSAIRRGFPRDRLLAKVGWVGHHELHRLDCLEFVTAAQTRDPDRRTVTVGSLERVFVALLDDYVDGLVEFPVMHDCLRLPRSLTSRV